MSETFNTASSGGQDDWLEQFEQAAAELDKQRHNLLRELSHVTEMACGVCGRRPTVRNDGFGDTLVACGHTLAAIEKQAKQDPLAPFDPLCCMRLELDDGEPAPIVPSKLWPPIGAGPSCSEIKPRSK